MAVNISTDTNTVKVTATSTNNVKIVDNGNNTSVIVSQPTTRIIRVATVGPQGPAGPSVDTGSFATTSSLQELIDITGSFATTGSNSFIGNQVITGSLIVSGSSTFTNIGPAVFSGSVVSTQGFTGSLQGIATTASFASTASFAPNYLPLAGGTISGSLTVTNNLTVLGSASIQYISESTLNIGTNLITVNTINPGARFGGLAVIDSGSSPMVSASFLYDSIQDEFLFIHKGTAGGIITSSIFLLGPETYNDLGNEIYLTANRIPKSVGNEHLNDSNISDNGTIVSINSNTQITGSVIATQGFTGSFSGSFTGSLFGTSSWATNAVTASYAMNGGGGSGGTDLGLVQAMTLGLQNIF